ncbi:hypothetical protein EPA93_19350 [Ktedonosporobacter rubrisoli]|uniref:Uncharacterized protein n=1 Tax=Ktedonosporobacter rubrisoli TaxID=2509675 RepID=A0A4P6JRT7_KTERU|nr:hypothetical protein [Ktedonosporobacter rubrisoli]QBD78033.1 hypothetical protein EPA93_19350 [Ktedonosporobacter rubrisoli]
MHPEGDTSNQTSLQRTWDGIILGIVGIIYAFSVPIFGYYQELILAGNLHWLVDAAHLFVGFCAFALIGAIAERLVRRKGAQGKTSSISKAA